MLVASLDVEQKSLEVITRSLVMMVELKNISMASFTTPEENLSDFPKKYR